MSGNEQNNDKKKTKDQLLEEITQLRKELLNIKGKKDNIFTSTITKGKGNKIPENTQLEKKWPQNGKLNSLAILAGGIAHDYNNIFTIICGNLAIAKTCECIDEELLNIFIETETALRRARDLTVKLRLLSKGSKPEKKPLLIKELLKETTRNMLFGTPVSCTFSFQKNLWPLKADKLQIEKVIQNLILNAKQELNKGGKIRIQVKNTLLQDSNIQGLSEGHYLKITISDNGTGIPKDNLKNIYKPYFSTKPGCEGLGLATACTIIRRHKGNMTVESKEGKGTTFSIYLPVNIHTDSE